MNDHTQAPSSLAVRSKRTDREESPAALAPPVSARTPSAEARLIQQLQQGDPEAGRQFARDYYPDVYRYLLYLTGRLEMAEDLAQETFLHAWRRLDTFEGRASLRVWLHRIAHREFLQALRTQRPQTSLEEVPELVPARDAGWVDAVELREAIRKLPDEEGEVVVLHYLHGYDCQEIAQILGTPVTTVKYRLMTARGHLQRELGEGDLAYLNEPGVLMRRWAWLPLEQMSALEARLSLVGSSWLRADGPAKAKTGSSRSEPSTIRHPPSTKKGERRMSDNNHAGMSRRKLLEAAGTAAAAAAAAGLAGPATAASPPRNEADIIDSRLGRKVTLAFKATAFSDLCDRLRSDTGIHLSAGPSVADEKVTLFCEHTPLREAMRQLSRPFGYTWLRSGTEGNYRYELVQDLRSQLLEEELRNRDRNAALLALDREMQRYRPYLDLSPDEALARARTTGAEEKPLLERLANKSWGAIQMYYRLTPNDLAALWAGQPIKFSADPGYPSQMGAGEQLLPADMVQGVLQSWRDWRIRSHDGQFEVGTEKEIPDGQLPVSVPEARAGVTFRLDHSELGQFTLMGGSGMMLSGHISFIDDGLATGVSPIVRDPENTTVHARQARDPALRRAVTVQPEASCPPAPGVAALLSPNPSPARGGAVEAPASAGLEGKLAHPSSGLPSPSRGGAGDGVGSEPRVTTADVLEALHLASGLPIIADFYTHLYSPSALTVQDRPLFDALNQLADAMHLRWNKEDAWLQFRSASFFNDRLKEVPNRLLARWSASRRRHTALALDDLLEIAQLSDVQLDSRNMAEGARDCWGLAEWDLARNTFGLRPHLRYLATLTPAQRQEAMGRDGLAFAKLSLPQQQQFIALALERQPDRTQSLDELAGATLRVDYTVPGWFQWLRPPAPGEPKWQELMSSPVRERARAAALQAARRLDPQADEAQIAPTELAVTVAYLWGQERSDARGDTRLSASVIRATPTSARVVSGWRQGESVSISDITKSG